jgi:hypothetical protein
MAVLDLHPNWYSSKVLKIRLLSTDDSMIYLFYMYKPPIGLHDSRLTDSKDGWKNELCMNYVISIGLRYDF